MLDYLAQNSLNSLCLGILSREDFDFLIRRKNTQTFSQGQRSLREKEYLCTDWSAFLLIDDVIAYARAHWLMKDRTKSVSGGSEQWFKIS